LRFGIFRLLYSLWGSLPTTGTPDPRLQEWRERIASDDFRYQLNHFRQCFEKFDRAAGHVTRCKEAKDAALGRWVERVMKRDQPGETREGVRELEASDPEWLEHLEITEFDKELPLFLDAMLFYLRIQADSFAQLVQYFYEPVKARVVPDNFTRQIDGEKAERLRKLDAGYGSILQANRKWFDDLRLDGGLRDVITHESGMIGVQWVKPQGGPIEAQTSLYTRKRPVEKNVLQALQEITAGWLAFLDEAYRHFVRKLTEEAMLRGLPVSDSERSRFFEAHELRGFWVYRVLNPKA
jgi:hypothetical protein